MSNSGGVLHICACEIWGGLGSCMRNLGRAGKLYLLVIEKRGGAQALDPQGSATPLHDFLLVFFS